MSSQVSPMQSFQAQNHGLQVHRSCANSFSSLTAHAGVGPAGADARHHRALRSYTQERAARRRSHLELWHWMLGPGNLRRPSMHAPRSLCCCCGVMRACSVAMRAGVIVSCRGRASHERLGILGYGPEPPSVRCTRVDRLGYCLQTSFIPYVCLSFCVCVVTVAGAGGSSPAWWKW